MAAVRTAISIDESLFEQAEDLARKLNLTRSGMFARAMAEYLARHRRETLLQEINAACAAPPDEQDEEEETALRAMQRLQRPILEANEW